MRSSGILSKWVPAPSPAAHLSLRGRCARWQTEEAESYSVSRRRHTERYAGRCCRTEVKHCQQWNKDDITDLLSQLNAEPIIPTFFPPLGCSRSAEQSWFCWWRSRHGPAGRCRLSVWWCHTPPGFGWIGWGWTGSSISRSSWNRWRAGWPRYQKSCKCLSNRNLLIRLKKKKKNQEGNILLSLSDWHKLTFLNFCCWDCFSQNKNWKSKQI